MYTVIGTVTSRTARVLWMLEEQGLPYDISRPRPALRGWRQVQPAGKVPVLIVDGSPSPIRPRSCTTSPTATAR